MKQSVKDYRLNAKQLRILKITYKFRFITPPLLAKYLQLKSRTTTYTNLENLVKKEYLQKRLDKNTDFSNKGARYCLASRAIKLLKAEPECSEGVLHARRGDKTVGEAFISEHIDILKACLLISDQNPNLFSNYTKAELAIYHYFPDSPPDIYIKRVEVSENLSSNFMLDIYANTLFFIIRKKLDQYFVHYESGDWIGVYPTLLIVCPNSGTEGKLQSYAENFMDNSGIDDMKIATTTYKAFFGNSDQSDPIWTKTSEPGKTYELIKL